MKAFFLLFVSLIFIGCESIVTIDLPNQGPKITINSIFTPDNNEWLVFVYESKGMYDYDTSSNLPFAFSPIKDATINIFENNSFLETAIYNDSIDGYIVYASPKPGATYTIKVDAPNMESAESTETVPIPVKINSITVNRKVSIDKESGELESDIIINFTDPSYEMNFYAIKANSILNGIKTEGVCFKSKDIVFDDKIFFLGDETYVQFCMSKGIFTDELINSKNYNITLTISDYLIKDADEIEIELFSTASSYYFYKNSLDLQSFYRGDPFAEPVIVFNNITNGLGIFTAYSKDYIRKSL